MRTVVYNDLLKQIVEKARRNYQTLNVEDAGVVMGHIWFHLRRIWNYAPWPEIVHIEQRAFAQDWVNSIAYGAGIVVWSVVEQKYYLSKLAVPAATSVTNSTYWQVTSAPTSTMQFVQYNRLEIGDPLRAWDQDPTVTTHARELPYVLGVEELKFRGTVQFVWLQFREKVPVLNSVSVGDGNTWSIPERLANILIARCAGDMLSSDGYSDEGAIWAARAQVELEDEAHRIWQQAGQADDFPVINN